jgi:hypothetical protein
MRLKSKVTLPSLLLIAKGRAKKLSSPLVLALSYSIICTSSSMLVAYAEGRLLDSDYIFISADRTAEIVPFIKNVSTLADFILLNPLVIFFLQTSRLQKRIVYEKMSAPNPLSPYHRFGLLILSLLFGAYAMKFYVEGSQFFDATLIPGLDGTSQITMTGWVVYSWTAVFIAFLFFGCAEQGFHVSYIIRLSEKDIPYVPLHDDESGGVRFLMEPSLSFGYAMIALLLVFVVFIVQDRLIYHIESNRLLGFALYIIVAIPSFGLPFYHLHRLMRARRAEYFFEISTAISRNISEPKNLRQGTWSEVQNYLSAIENIEKYKKALSAFPVWPAPVSLSLPPFGSIIAASLPVAHKLVTLALSGIGIAVP